MKSARNCIGCGRDTINGAEYCWRCVTPEGYQVETCLTSAEDEYTEDSNADSVYMERDRFDSTIAHF